MSIPTPLQSNNEARDAIMRTIRAHLAAGTAVAVQAPPESPAGHEATIDGGSALAIFCERLESVGGHCVVVRTEDEAARAVGDIVSSLQAKAGASRIALSDAPLIATCARGIAAAEIAIGRPASDLFNYDVGITMAQAAIAETGTLILEAEAERHRLVSLLPPVHIAIVKANDFCLTIGEALARLQNRDGGTMSRAISFITGPSRTADIELTLTVGVHGPKELYVIVIDGSRVGS